ncbi:MAG: hypothetical protein E7620_05160 [Ruminococcaceae bacterium]|nr:hypothetical protein [Oscillospiraceae bacterium]
MKSTLWSFYALLFNLIPFSLVSILAVSSQASKTVLLAIGGVLTVIGIVWTAIIHNAWWKNTAPSALLAMAILGSAKGLCGSAILVHFFTVTESQINAAAFFAFSAALALFLSLAALLLIPWVKDHPKRILLPLLFAAIVGATVYLIHAPSPLALLLLFFSLTVTFCLGARLIEFDTLKELRFNLCMASMLYAVAVFLVALLLIAGDGCDCDGGSCDCGDCGGDGKKKKTKK